MQSPHTRVLPYEPAQKLFTAAIEPAGPVRVCSIEQVDPLADSQVKDLLQLAVHLLLVVPVGEGGASGGTGGEGHWLVAEWVGR